MAGKVVESTADIIESNGPSILATSYWEANPGDGAKPGFLPRLQMAAGSHKSGADPHIAGRALDIILFANKPSEKDVADRLVQAFLSVKDKLKFISICYNHWEWNGAGVKFPKEKNPHTTHIHIEWAAANMNLTGFEDDLSRAIQAMYPEPAP